MNWHDENVESHFPDGLIRVTRPSRLAPPPKQFANETSAAERAEREKRIEAHARRVALVMGFAPEASPLSVPLLRTN